MKRYESYKDSGVKWIGEIPEHWEVKRFRFIFSENKNNNSKLLEKNQLQFKYGEIVSKDRQDISDDIKKIISNYSVVQEGDIMINGLNLNYDFVSQRVAIVREKGVITSAYISLRARNGINSKFYNYFMKAMDCRKMFHGMGSGIRLTLAYDNLKNLFFPCPKFAEQTAIANYLDSVTSKIDEAISQQQKMIGLLNERKQIIIQNAVTKGLDPNAKMKDSGVEWIGEIPEDWEVKRMRYIGDAKNGLTYSPSDIVEQSNGILVLRSSNIENGRLVFKDNVYVKKCNPKLYVKKGDIIICSRNGSASLVGKCAIVDNEIEASFGAFMMRFRSYNHNKYIYYLLTSAISHYKQLFSTSTINQLTLSIFANIKMPICSHYIQKDIADYLDDTTSKIDSSISQCNKMISLLQERKQIIINDVVTGKVKVV